MVSIPLLFIVPAESSATSEVIFFECETWTDLRKGTQIVFSAAVKFLQVLRHARRSPGFTGHAVSRLNPLTGTRTVF